MGKVMSSAYGEVRHFAGGLISHPAESTKHLSILRHAIGIMYYTGLYTNLATTGFADRASCRSIPGCSGKAVHAI